MTILKRTITLLLAFFTFSAVAALDIRPGLWKIEMKIRTAGEVIDPAKEIEKAMEDLPPGEQVQMQEALEEVAGLDEKGRIEACYEGSHFSRTQTVSSFNNQECISKEIKRGRSRVASEFICLDGTTGKTTWIIHSKEKYTGIVKVISSGGDESEMVYRGKYVSPVCEDIPIIKI